MRHVLRPILVALAFICLFPLVAEAGSRAKKSGSANNCPWWRPCGPGETWGGNRFIPQGAFGVDARPACQRHDDCYDDQGRRRKDCDVAFYNELKALCPYSTHPWLCKQMARAGYLGVRLFGASAKKE